MTKLVIAALEFAIRNPDGNASRHFSHLLIDTFAHLGTEAIRAAAKSANPEFLRESASNAIDGILETAVAVGIGSNVPRPMSSIGVGAAR